MLLIGDLRHWSYEVCSLFIKPGHSK